MVIDMKNRYNIGSLAADTNRKYAGLVQQNKGAAALSKPLSSNYETGTSETIDPADTIQCCVTPKNVMSVLQGAALVKCALRQHELTEQLSLIKTAVKSMNAKDLELLSKGKLRAISSKQKNISGQGGNGYVLHPKTGALNLYDNKQEVRKDPGNIAYLLPSSQGVSYKGAKGAGPQQMLVLYLPATATPSNAAAHSGVPSYSQASASKTPSYNSHQSSSMRVNYAHTAVPMGGYVTYTPVEAKCGCEKKGNHSHAKIAPAVMHIRK